MAAGEQYVI